MCTRGLGLAAVVVLAACSNSDTAATSHDLFPAVDIGTTSQDAGSCTAANCSTCCLGNTCQLSGNALRACGLGGAACSVCRETESCIEGACRLNNCDPTSCGVGCCDRRGECQQGTAAEACGEGGEPCEVCAEAQQCASRQCVAKDGTMYQVTLVSATVDNGWSLTCGLTDNSLIALSVPELACDPVVSLTVGTTTATSKAQGNTDTPAWNELLMTAKDTEITSKFHVQVGDSEVNPLIVSAIGECDWTITSAELAAGKKVGSCGDKVKDLTFEFKLP